MHGFQSPKQAASDKVQKERYASATSLVTIEVDETGFSEPGQALVEQKVLGCSRAGRTSLNWQLCQSRQEASTPSA